MGPKVKTDWIGRPIAIETTDQNGRTKVTSWVGKPLGDADDKGTRDFIGRPISAQRAPGMLYGDDEENED